LGSCPQKYSISVEFSLSDTTKYKWSELCRTANLQTARVVWRIAIRSRGTQRSSRFDAHIRLVAGTLSLVETFNVGACGPLVLIFSAKTRPFNLPISTDRLDDSLPLHARIRVRQERVFLSSLVFRDVWSLRTRQRLTRSPGRTLCQQPFSICTVQICGHTLSHQSKYIDAFKRLTRLTYLRATQSLRRGF